jgi:hypothetical protein
MNIADKIIAVLLERAGFDRWWYDVTEELQNEIKKELLEAVLTNTNRNV